MVRTAKHVQELIVLNIRPLAASEAFSVCVCIVVHTHLHISGLSLRSGTPSLSTGGTAGLTDTTGALQPDLGRRKRRARGWGERSCCAGFRGRAGGTGRAQGALSPLVAPRLVPSSAGAERGGERSGPAEPQPRRAAGTAGGSRALTAGPFRSPGV